MASHAALHASARPLSAPRRTQGRCRRRLAPPRCSAAADQVRDTSFPSQFLIQFGRGTANSPNPGIRLTAGPPRCCCHCGAAAAGAPGTLHRRCCCRGPAAAGPRRACQPGRRHHRDGAAGGGHGQAAEAAASEQGAHLGALCAGCHRALWQHRCAACCGTGCCRCAVPNGRVAVACSMQWCHVRDVVLAIC